MPEPQYSPDIIRRYREEEARHAFDRDIRGRRPVGLEDDWVLLSCGHETTMNYRQIDLLLEAAEHLAKDSAASGLVHCRECARAWLRENAGGELE
jgi:hypothetical protein